MLGEDLDPLVVHLEAESEEDEPEIPLEITPEHPTIFELEF